MLKLDLRLSFDLFFMLISKETSVATDFNVSFLMFSV